MTQPSTSDNHLPSADLTAVGNTISEGNDEQSSILPDSTQPAIVHPNFDPSRLPLDPARPLSDIPEPARRLHSQLQRLYGRSAHFHQPKEHSLSKWALIASEVFGEHLALLRAAELVELPDSFYHNHSAQPLLASLNTMTLLDMVDIQQALRAYPKLHRYGFALNDSPVSTDTSVSKNAKNQQMSLRALTKRYNPDE